MHELGIIIEVVKTVEDFAKKNGVTKIDKLVLQIGEIATIIPKYVEEVYPCAVDGTFMQDTKLEIEILPANAICKKCNKVFNVVANKNICPACGSDDREIVSGKEFMIKEIVAC